MMQQLRNIWRELVERELHDYAAETLGSSDSVNAVGPVTVQKPPKPEMGDLAFPLFAYAKVFRSSPNKVAEVLRDRLVQREDLPKGELFVAGPYLNVRVDIAKFTDDLYRLVMKKAEAYGSSDLLAGKRVMVEFSCPNTNKPLHLGHLRNDSIGESISAILKANGEIGRAH